MIDRDGRDRAIAQCAAVRDRRHAISFGVMTRSSVFGGCTLEYITT
ncbi:hypothetical protein BDSB_25090 [Burkholderia dolosa PC543]|nr:hypothetical protein BDSB_25090 [Burkholderia dolosa PC543]